MSTVMFWTGVVAWIVVGALLLWIAAEVAWGFVCAVSYNRWIVRRAIAEGRFRKLHWRELPQCFLSNWWEYIGYRNNGSTTVTCQRTGSVWRGVGDYTMETGATP